MTFEHELCYCYYAIAVTYAIIIVVMLLLYVVQNYINIIMLLNLLLKQIEK